jgi:hypothetical protein
MSLTASPTLPCYIRRSLGVGLWRRAVVAQAAIVSLGLDRKRDGG